MSDRPMTYPDFLRALQLISEEKYGVAYRQKLHAENEQERRSREALTRSPHAAKR